jgi:Na+/H+ antiporter NhaD/arsenite permease-like protein
MFPPLPDPHALAVLILVAFALILFTRESLPLETSSLAVLVLLIAGFEIFPYTDSGGAHFHAMDFFSGFGHEALIAVCALMIAGQELVRTGALEPVGRTLAKLWALSPSLSLLLTLLVGAVLSAFVNNVPIVVLLLPILIGISLRTGLWHADAHGDGDAGWRHEHHHWHVYQSARRFRRGRYGSPPVWDF